MDANRNLWGDCAAWLTRCKVIPAETKIYQNLPNSAVELLARTLRDGVLLCNLLSYLDDSSIEEGDIIQKSQMSEIHCVQNISLFLQICKHYYGLCESDLFDPMMLFDMRNFRKVLSTLSKLSRCTRVTQLHPNLCGFDVPIVSDELNAGLKAVYMNLEATTISKTIEPLDKNLRLSKAEIVYQKLCSAQPQQLSGQRKTRTKRDYVINELVGTETNYLGVLHALRDSFMKPLSAVLSEDELRTIFPCIPELVEIHEHFLDRLRDATSTSPSVQISEVFLHACKPFLVYGEYLSSISDPFKTLEGILSKNTDFKRILNQCQLHNNCNGVQLHEILTVPMQRFLKYPLLLRALIAETPNTHVDFRGLKAAKKAMIELAEYTNAVKSDSENLEIIQMVKERVVGLKLPEGNDLKMYGLLLHHGELSIGTVEEKEVRNVYAFIFHKLLILVEQTTPIKISNYTFRESHNLADFKVESCNNKYFTIGRDGKSRHQMRLIHKSTSAAITFYMKSAAELNQWENALNEAIYVLQPFGTTTTDHKFTITSYTEPTVCDHCSKFLNGLIHQGYRCSGCTISVHRSCISSTGRCKNNTTIPERKTFRNHPFSEFYWFVGEMDRNRATKQLRHRKIGTYLLRVRKQGVVNVAETIYALGLKTVKREIRHIKIYQTRDESATLLYYLSNNQQFRSIEDLVSFYEHNELGEIFNGLNQRLQWPFRGVLATALYDFSPCESIQSNQLALREGCLVLVIAKMGDSNGWWRGKSMGYVGYFPKDFVRVDRPSNFQL